MPTLDPTTSRFAGRASNRSTASTYIINPAAEDEISLDVIFDKEEPEDFIPVPERTAQKQKSAFYIDSKFESLDYDVCENQLVLVEEKTKGFHYVVGVFTRRIFIYFLAGIIVAFFGSIVDTGIKQIGFMRYQYMSNFFDKVYADNSISPFVTHLSIFLVWIAATLVFVIIGSALVVFFEPTGGGGGVAQAVAFLNGVNVPKVLSIKGLFVKVIGTICSNVSGLAAGKEGPMMHIGAMCGGLLPIIGKKIGLKSFFAPFTNDHEIRDFTAAGFGAGLAVAFNAPVGGLLIALEEGVSFWNLNLMWKIFICTVTSTFMSVIVLSVYKGTPGDMSNPEILILGKVTDTVTTYELVEFPLFAFMGIIGGLLGSSLVAIHVCITQLRKKYVNTKARKFTEAILVGILVAVFGMISVFSVHTCKVDTHSDVEHGEPRTTSKLYCPDGHISVMALLFIQTQENIIHMMFQTPRDTFTLKTLLVYSICYYILLCLTMGLQIPAGLFVPQVVFGAVWGRFIGTICAHFFGTDWAKPAKYAYIGATAQLSGALHKSFSILVLMTEASGSIHLLFPLMLVVIMTNIVGNFFTLGLYDVQVHMMGLPFLYSDPPPLCKQMKTKEIMSKQPVYTLPLKPTIKTILMVLHQTRHNGFPIVDSQYTSVENSIKSEGRMIGLVLRQQLLVLLKYKTFKYPEPKTTKQFLEQLEYFRNEERHILTMKDVKVKKKYFDATLNLSIYMNPSPYTAHMNMSITRVHTLFRSIGLRHIIIVNATNEAVGLVTRKDLAKFHLWEHVCHMGIEELQIR